MEKETIQFAAIKRPDNCIVYGKDHGECMIRSPMEFCGKDCIQGFLTNTFRFVGRIEARRIAFKAKQIDQCDDGDQLISEELWFSPYGGKFDYDPVKGYVERNNHGIC